MSLSSLAPSSKTVLISLFCLSIFGCNNSSSSDSETPNQAPIVQAIAPEPIQERETLSLKASAEDPDGSITSYNWQQLSGPSITAPNQDGANFSFTLPDITQDESLDFRLTVTDDDNATTSLDFSFTVLAYANLETVNIQDLALLNCLQAQQVDLGTKKITCDHYPIFSLADLHFFPQLTHLTVTNARLENVSTLSSLTNLVQLNLAGNQLSNKAMAAVTSMQQLKELDLSQNRITNFYNYLSYLENLEIIRLINPGSHEFYWQTSELDLASINNMPNIKELHLANIKLRSQAELQELSAVTQLTLAATGESLTDLSFLTGLTRLTYLDLEFNTQLVDIGVLASLISLQYLDISYSEIDNITPLSGLTQLQVLKLKQSVDNNPLDLSMLVDLKAMQQLDLSDNTNLLNTQNLAAMSELKILALHRTNSIDIGFLRPLSKLEQLDLSENANLTDISPVSTLTMLEKLDISTNPELLDLSAIASLSELVELKALDLKGEFASDIKLDLTPLANLAKLQDLDLSFNPNLQNIHQLNTLPELKSLTLTNTYIETLPSLDKLSKLQYLDLSVNRFEVLPQLNSNPALNNLTLDNNPNLTNLSSLQSLNNLQTLSLKDVRNLSELSIIGQLSTLENLTLSYNSHLTSTQTLATLTQLQSLVLQDMPELSDISTLQNINSLKRLDVQSSPKIPCYQQVELTNNRPDIDFTASNFCAQ